MLEAENKKKSIKSNKKKAKKYIEFVDKDEGDEEQASVLKKPSEIQTAISRKNKFSAYQYSQNKRAKIIKTNRLLYKKMED